MSETAPVATPTAEAPAVEASKAPEPVVEKPNSSKLLDFARKEADFAKKEVARKEEIAKLQEQLKTFEEEVSYYRGVKDTYKSNPQQLLSKLGITYDELTEAILDYHDSQEANAKPPDAESIRKEIEAQFRKQQEEVAAEAQAQALQSFTKEIGKFVEDNKGNYPHLTNLYKPFGQTETPEELIFSVVENYFEETGELLTLEAAAAAAEEHFREEWSKLNGNLSLKTATPTTGETKSEKINTPPATPATPAPEVESKTLNHNAFVRKESPSITNNFAKPTTRVPYKGADNSRKDVIEKAVAAMEAAARR